MCQITRPNYDKGVSPRLNNTISLTDLYIFLDFSQRLTNECKFKKSCIAKMLNTQIDNL
jgi:hypothetical protein